MQTTTTEIADGIYRFSTLVPEVAPPAGFGFNQFLILADEPLLFHTGMRMLFPLVSAAVARVIPLERLRWISFGHVEADECGAMNQWLAAAPRAQVLFNPLGCEVSLNDLADRPPLPLPEGESLDLGGKRVRLIHTPHVPHGWEAQALFEETGATLFCGDLFTHIGETPAVTADDIVEPAMAAEAMFGASSLSPATAPTIRRLAELAPRTLAVMHGASFAGDGAAALRALADRYEALVREPPKSPPAPPPVEAPAISDGELLAGQADYYRARAGEYDDWWQRLGRYDHGPEATQRWHGEVAMAEEALTAAQLAGDVLELACGTGWWTERLARTARSLHCVDASPEVIAFNRARLIGAGLPLPDYEVADLFAWEPDRTYDAVFFSFWLSHVPDRQFDHFWSLVAKALKPGGRVFFIDSAPSETSGPLDRCEPEMAGVQQRKLADGRAFGVVKIFYDPAGLSARLAALGWRVDVSRTPSYFIYGQGNRTGAEKDREPGAST